MKAGIDNERLHRWWLAMTALLLVALLLPVTAVAADTVGRVLSVRGAVTASLDDAAPRQLVRGDAIHEGDEIETGPAGRAQVRFIDEGLVNLSPRTTFGVDEYHLEEDEEEGGSVVMSFLRGAMRTVTGLIGDRDEDTYRMNTPTATIGVRGTGYALQYCDATCAQEFGGQPGLYGRVDEGSVQVDTPQGSAEFGAGSFFFVPEGGAPETILQPPSGILDGEEDEGDGDGGDPTDGVEVTPLEEDEGDDSLLGEGGETDEPEFEGGDEFEQDFFVDTIAAGVAIGVSDGESTQIRAGLFDEEDEGFLFETDDEGRVTSAALISEGLTQVADATLLEQDMIEDLGVGWGRWEGEFLDGEDIVSGNMAFTVTDNLTEPEVLGELSGGFEYNLAGGPSAFDSVGNLWTVDELDLGVVFGANSFVQLVQFELTEVDGGGALSFDSGTGSIDGQDLIVTEEFLRLEGQFIGAEADGLIVVFDINEQGGITGTSVLEQGGTFNPPE